MLKNFYINNIIFISLLMILSAFHFVASIKRKQNLEFYALGEMITSLVAFLGFASSIALSIVGLCTSSGGAILGFTIFGLVVGFISFIVTIRIEARRRWFYFEGEDMGFLEIIGHILIGL